MPDKARRPPKTPVDAFEVPRYAGFSTFARLPRIDEVEAFDIAVVGVPFDSGTTYRPGARFGPSAIRQASRLLRRYDPSLDTQPFEWQQVVDAGDLPCNPFDIETAIGQIQAAALYLRSRGGRLIAIGGDHTIALPLLRATRAGLDSLAVLHFDAHLDTWDTYFGARFTHGSPFRRAFEEGLIDAARNVHVGTRGPIYAREDLDDDARFGFKVITSEDLDDLGVAEVVKQIRNRVGDTPLYISIDVDVMDPSHAPGTGTPEAGGITSRELLKMLRGLEGMNIAGADVVEVAPAYDHAEITSLAAAHMVYCLLSLFAKEAGRHSDWGIRHEVGDA
jgi:guanidinobutyrase / D-arginase